VTVNTITNGFLVGEDVADQLVETFSAIEISLDGATADVHDRVRARRGSFERVMRAIKLLVARGADLTVAFTPTLLNMDDFRRVVRLMAVVGGVRNIVTGYIMPIGRAYRNPYTPSAERQERFKAEVLAVREEYAGTLRVSFTDPVTLVARQLEDRLPNAQFHLMANGDVGIVPLLPIVFGNVLTGDLRSLWRRRLSVAWLDSRVRRYARALRDSPNLTAQERIPWVDPPIRFENLAAAGDMW
jgi:MoaA/NifB/PqqE/SkfB family radical SAM enzyme